MYAEIIVFLRMDERIHADLAAVDDPIRLAAVLLHPGSEQITPPIFPYSPCMDREPMELDIPRCGYGDDPSGFYHPVDFQHPLPDSLYMLRAVGGDENVYLVVGEREGVGRGLDDVHVVAGRKIHADILLRWKKMVKVTIHVKSTNISDFALLGDTLGEVLEDAKAIEMHIVFG
jgi:hypothetical protein